MKTVALFPSTNRANQYVQPNDLDFIKEFRRIWVPHKPVEQVLVVFRTRPGKKWPYWMNMAEGNDDGNDPIPDGHDAVERLAQDLIKIMDRNIRLTGGK